MRFIYIQNYLNISKEKKLEFIKYIFAFKDYKVINQKIVLNDNALILELSKESSFDIAKSLIDRFFQNHKDIKIFFVDSLFIEQRSVLILKKENKVVRSVNIK